MNNSSNFTIEEEGELEWMYDIGIEDASWVLTASMIIFTMQTGKFFGVFKHTKNWSINEPHILNEFFLKDSECSNLVAFQ